MYGEDKTALEELTKTVTELEGLKIEIIEKTEKTNELNNAVEKMENQIKQADDKILNDTHFANTGNETTTENEQNVNEENTTNTQSEIAISKDSNINILIDNINTLVNKVNEQVKAETERKAEEERKAKEEEERKAQEQALANVLNGDFTYFAGTYTEIDSGGTGSVYGTPRKLTVDKNSIGGKKIISTKKTSKGSYFCTTRFEDEWVPEQGFEIYPIGVKAGFPVENINKVRIYETGGNRCRKSISKKLIHIKIEAVDLFLLLCNFVKYSHNVVIFKYIFEYIYNWFYIPSVITFIIAKFISYYVLLFFYS